MYSIQAVNHESSAETQRVSSKREANQLVRVLAEAHAARIGGQYQCHGAITLVVAAGNLVAQYGYRHV